MTIWCKKNCDILEKKWKHKNIWKKGNIEIISDAIEWKLILEKILEKLNLDFFFFFFKFCEKYLSKIFGTPFKYI